MFAPCAVMSRIESFRRLRASPGIAWRIVSSLVAVGLTAQLYAQSAATVQLLHRAFVDKDFAANSYRPVRWLKGGKSYATLEPSRTEGATDIVRYDIETGQRDLLVSGQKLVATGEKKPISIDDYSLSDDLNRVLIFTNSKRVWRRNTRGDYWVLDRNSGELKKLGDVGPPSTLMFAKFSPDGTKVAYVRFNNIFVEDLQTGEIARLTTDGSEKIVNGTSDWVYEEEFELRDGFRWSPDGTHIAYWQFDTTPVKTFALTYDTGAPYKVVTNIPYPDFGVYPRFARSRIRRREHPILPCESGSYRRWAAKLAGFRFLGMPPTITSRAWSGATTRNHSYYSISTVCRTRTTSCLQM
jgi:dipeptidyl-peptidase 4